MQDVVIIGSGPAGLSAALYMLRGGFSTTVIGKDNGALEKAEKIENYFGLERPLSGHELIEMEEHRHSVLAVLFYRMRLWGSAGTETI